MEPQLKLLGLISKLSVAAREMLGFPGLMYWEAPSVPITHMKESGCNVTV